MGKDLRVASNRVASGQREAVIPRRLSGGTTRSVFDEPRLDESKLDAVAAPATGERPTAVKEPAPAKPETDGQPAPAVTAGEPRNEPRLGITGVVGLAILVPSLAVVLGVLILKLTSLTQALLLAIPVALFGAGLERVGKALHVRPLRATGAFVVVLAVGGPLVLSATPSEPLGESRYSSPVPAGAAEAKLQASMDSGELHIRPGGSGLFRATLRSAGRSTAQVSGSGAVAVVDVDAPPERGLLARNRGSNWDLGLSTGLPWEVSLDSGAVTADLDLQELNVTKVAVDAGPSRLVLRLGQPGSRTPVAVNLDAGTVDLYLPRSTPIELQITGGVVKDFGDRPLQSDGPVWRSGPTDGHAYLINLHMRAGRFRLHWR
jgi:hypothetical protein